MDRFDFNSHLLKATKETLDSTRKLILEDVSDSYLYVIRGNYGQGNFAPRCRPDLHTGNSMIDINSVKRFLYWEGMMPELIRIQVVRLNSTYSTIRLSCDERYVDAEETLPKIKNLALREIWPFSVRLSPFPQGWLIKEKGVPNVQKSMEQNGRFSFPKNLTY